MQHAEENHPAPPELLSTHPGSGHRQERLQKLLPKAQEVAAESGCGSIAGYGKSRCTVHRVIKTNRCHLI